MVPHDLLGPWDNGKPILESLSKVLTPLKEWRYIKGCTHAYTFPHVVRDAERQESGNTKRKDDMATALRRTVVDRP